MEDYYRKRALEYEEVYHRDDPKRKEELEKISAAMQGKPAVAEIERLLEDPVNFWAQPNIANRITKIEGYRVQVEGLTYSKRNRLHTVLEPHEAYPHKPLFRGITPAIDAMVEVKYEPYKELIIHEIRKMTLPNFLLMVASQVEAQKQGAMPSIDWIDGIVFVKGDYAPPVPPLVTEDQFKGRLHYPMVFFAETSYEPQKRVTLNGRDVLIRLNKADSNPVFVDMVKFLKAFKPSPDESLQVNTEEKSEQEIHSDKST